jgi:hypothetical protein
MNIYQQQAQDPNMTRTLNKFFPGKLRIMLDTVGALGLAQGISW